MLFPLLIDFSNVENVEVRLLFHSRESGTKSAGIPIFATAEGRPAGRGHRKYPSNPENSKS